MSYLTYRYYGSKTFPENISRKSFGTKKPAEVSGNFSPKNKLTLFCGRCQVFFTGTETDCNCRLCGAKGK